MNTLVGKKATYSAIIGVVLQEERDVCGVTQASAAIAAGLTQSTWARLENGKACTAGVAIVGLFPAASTLAASGIAGYLSKRFPDTTKK